MMFPALKAEIRKLMTVRSTYVILGLVIAMVIFYSFYIVGWRSAVGNLQAPDTLTSNIIGALTSLPPILGAIVAILLMTHEYRYNTILHTLTSTNRRWKVLVAKFVTISIFALVFTAGVALLTSVFMYLGAAAHGHSIGAQTIHYRDFIWRCLYYGWAYIITALLLAALIRNQIAAVVSIFALPTLEQLLSLLLKQNSVYMPHMALGQVLGQGESMRTGTLSPGKAAAVFGMYLAVGWIAAFILFVKRDAN